MSKLGTARVVVVSALVTLGFVSVVAGQDQKPGAPPVEIVVYTSDLPKSALFEFEVWSDSTSPGGKMVGTPNTGDMLHPPPEEDPHVRFKVSVQSGVPYRCWIHMKVGAPKGVAFDQFVLSPAQFLEKPPSDAIVKK